MERFCSIHVGLSLKSKPVIPVVDQKPYRPYPKISLTNLVLELKNQENILPRMRLVGLILNETKDVSHF